MKLKYKTATPKVPALSGLVKNIITKKEDQPKIFEIIKAVRPAFPASIRMLKLYQIFKAKARYFMPILRVDFL